jgi:hypothetical protein
VDWEPKKLGMRVLKTPSIFKTRIPLLLQRKATAIEQLLLMKLLMGNP